MLLHCVHRGLGQSMTPTTRSCSKWGWGRHPRSLTQSVRSCSTLLAGVWSMTRTRGPRRWSCFLTRFWRWVMICSITINNSFTLQIRWKLELLSQLKWIKHFVFLMQMNGVQTGWGRWWVYIVYNAFDSGRLSQAGHQEIKCGKHNLCIN